MSEKTLPLRAITYQPVAMGTCPACELPDVPIRFVFNPYGPDDLLCVPCGDARDAEFAEHQHPDQPHTPHPASEAARELGDVFSTFRDNLVKKYGADSDKVKRYDGTLKGDQDDG